MDDAPSTCSGARSPEQVEPDGRLPPSALGILSQELRRACPEAAPEGWQRLDGGRSNLCWRIAAPGGDLVLKLYRPARAGPVFPNDPEAEARCLIHLDGQRLAPQFLARWQGALGPCLVYRHLPGPLWQGDGRSLGRLLRRLHDHPVPEGVRRAPDGSAALRLQIAAQIDGHAGARDLLAGLPGDEVAPFDRPVLLHGDPVAGNLVDTPGGLRLIDWQCPALGDPCLDLATVLSPAMSHLYLGRVLTAAEAGAFLAAYDRPALIPRLRQLQPFLSARMISHCLCRAAEGSAEDARAADLERQGWVI
ncbi:MAG: phosphotransferase [Rhodobacteraceae bacterium]|nr:phosphotransferase [Paracoccaceae bacterium]MBR9821119.1 phosphotransferase [Paracoccaceae bacterium]